MKKLFVLITLAASCIAGYSQSQAVTFTVTPTQLKGLQWVVAKANTADTNAQWTVLKYWQSNVLVHIESRHNEVLASYVAAMNAEKEAQVDPAFYAEFKAAFLAASSQNKTNALAELKK